MERYEKLRDRATPAEIKKREDFKESLDNLLDIAQSNALALIKIQKDRDCLIAQREKGRRGAFGRVNFCIPGPVHHARWISKAIYCLKYDCLDISSS